MAKQFISSLKEGVFLFGFDKILENGLKKIEKLQRKGTVFSSENFEPKELTELKRLGFLKSIIRGGWYHLSSNQIVGYVCCVLRRIYLLSQGPLLNSKLKYLVKSLLPNSTT